MVCFPRFGLGVFSLLCVLGLPIGFQVFGCGGFAVCANFLGFLFLRGVGIIYVWRVLLVVVVGLSWFLDWWVCALLGGSGFGRCLSALALMAGCGL